MRTRPILKPLLGSPAADYLLSHGFSPRLAEEAGVCYASRWPHWIKLNGHWRLLGTDRRIVFPYYDFGEQEGVLTAVSAFAISPRYLRSTVLTNGQRWRGVFSVPGAFQALPLLFVQTPFDVLAFAACGFPALAVGDQEVSEWALQAASLRIVCLATHNGERGDRLAEKLAERLAAYPVECFRLRPACRTWLEELHTYDVDGLRLRLKAELGQGVRRATRLRVGEASAPRRERLSEAAALSWDQLLHHPPDPWKYHSEWKKRHLGRGDVHELTPAL